MKNITTLVLALFTFTMATQAQTKVRAETIIKQLNNGENISYENVIIQGDLKFIDLKDKEIEKGSTKKSSLLSIERIFITNSTTEYIAQVRNAISFTNCTFTGKVVAYLSNDDNELFNVKFHENTHFVNCTFENDALCKYVNFEKESTFRNSNFEEEANFKYTKFNSDVSFVNSNFEEEANFKYSDFPEKVDFGNCKFENDANFKYTDFVDYVDFSNCLFEGDAIFKYCKFPNGVSFEKSVFKNYADFKYSNFRKPFNMNNVHFNDDVDFKYTQLNGKDFNIALLENSKF